LLRAVARSLSPCLALLALVSPALAAKLLSIEGADTGGYGRIALTFDSPVTVKAKIAGSVLVIGFGETAPGGSERLATAMPNYVSVLRRDPDATGLRIALQKPYRLNVQQAGERTYVDLLPETWSGLPPPVPQAVVTDLAKRAYTAEQVIKAATPVPVAKPLAIEVAHLPTLTRLTLRLPEDIKTSQRREGPATLVTIPGAWKIEQSDTRGRLRPAVARFSVDGDGTASTLTVEPAEGYTVSTDRDDEGLSIDVAKQEIGRKDAKAEAGKSEAPKPETGTTEPAKAEAGPGDAKAQARGGASGRASEAGSARTDMEERSRAGVPSGVREAVGDLVFPFGKAPAAALFGRGGTTFLVFETAGSVALPASAATAGIAGPPKRVGSVQVLRFPAPAGKLLDLLPVGPLAAPTGWELLIGDSLGPSDALVVTRAPLGAGRIGLGVRLPDPGAATWLDLDGERVAVVTTLGRRPSGVAKRQRFVDFELLPSRLGVAVLAQADDLLVRPDLDGVSIGREGGLAVSAVERPAETVASDVEMLAVERKTWDEAKRGDVRESLRRLFEAVVEQPLSLRGPARLAYARTLIANGYDPEGLTVLDAIAADDPVLGAQREIAILRGAAMARLGRTAETRKILSTKALARDPEAALWRGLAEVTAGLWLDAEGLLRAGSPILDRYPDDLQVVLRTAAAEASVETGDLEAAKRQIALAAQLTPDPLTRDRLKMVTARIDEGMGQTVPALAAYDKLAESAEQPVAAAATLRGTLLAHSTGRLKAPDAIERLERLALMWHGGWIEAELFTGLARLYRETGRWRESFVVTRRVDLAGPESATARALHNEAQAMFDDLFLSDLGAKMTGVQAVALYFDFKDFGPVGRRGDEIVRRLSDRLIALDLLESAAELLQHQVDHRLAGPARASVATRLAAVRLMDGQPLKALETLDATYLPELPSELRRARMLLRARALSDLSRTDLALETLEGDVGPDAQRLRADILWAARRWREAGESHEMLLGEVWRGGKPLDDAARADVIRAAIAYGLASESLGLERLKAKFAGPMAESADARTFALLTAPNAIRNPVFREIAQRASTAQTLAAFMDEYRKRYPDIALPERGRRAAGAEAPPPG